MLAVSREVRLGYGKLLTSKGIQQVGINRCQKWLRFYLDFCHKYQHAASSVDSIKPFLMKLAEKRQTVQVRTEAERAVAAYYEYVKLQSHKNCETRAKTYVAERLNTAQNNKIKPKKIEKVGNALKPVEDERQKRCGTKSSWKNEYEGLENTIRLKHYSKQTLKSYRNYVRGFQTYTQSLQPELLTTEHVKSYLTYLAVEKKFLLRHRILHLTLCSFSSGTY